MLKRVLVIGGSGLLGTSLINQYKHDYQVFSTHLHNQPKDVTSIRLNLLDVDSITKTVEKVSPDLIIHTAAAKDISWCQNNEKDAHAINVEGTRHVVRAAKSIDARLVYISTDAVFDGVRGFYNEGDKVSPVNIYGKTKHEGENECILYKKSLVLRSAFFGFSIYREKESFIPNSVRKLSKDEIVYAAKDRLSNPLEVSLLSNIIRELEEKGLSGLFHVGCAEYMNNFDVGKKIAEIFGFEPSLVRETRLSDIKERAIFDYPLNTSLDTKKVRSYVCLPNMSESLEVLKLRFKNEYDYGRK